MIYFIITIEYAADFAKQFWKGSTEKDSNMYYAYPYDFLGIIGDDNLENTVFLIPYSKYGKEKSSIHDVFQNASHILNCKPITDF